MTQSLRGCANSCLPPAAAQEAVVSRAHQETPPKHSVDRNRPNRPRSSGKKKKRKWNPLSNVANLHSFEGAAPCLVSLAGRSRKTSESDTQQEMKQLADCFI